MKKILTVAAIICIGIAANAQSKSGKKLNFNVGLEAGLPVGDFNLINGFGFGGSVKGLYNLSENNDLTFSVGYISFGGKSTTITLPIIGSTTVTNPATGVIPIKAGYRLSFSGGFYVEPQLGYSLFSGGGSSSGAFTYAPNIGMVLNEKLDLGLRYEAASKSGSTLSHLGLRVAYNF